MVHFILIMMMKHDSVLSPDSTPVRHLTGPCIKIRHSLSFHTRTRSVDATVCDTLYGTSVTQNKAIMSCCPCTVTTSHLQAACLKKETERRREGRVWRQMWKMRSERLEPVMTQQGALWTLYVSCVMKWLMFMFYSSSKD